MSTGRMSSFRQPRARLIARALAVTLLVVSPVCSMAGQGDRFVGAHEVPPFVCERVEFAHAFAVDTSRWDPWTWFYGATVPGVLCPSRVPVPHSYG